jgi:hypothetical protein
VEFVIEPEPGEDERAAVLAALEQLNTFAPRPTERWGRPEIELVEAEDTWHASGGGSAPASPTAAATASRTRS